MGYTITLEPGWVCDDHYPDELVCPNGGVFSLNVGLAKDYPAVEQGLTTYPAFRQQHPERYKTIEFRGWSGELFVYARPRHTAVIAGKTIWVRAATNIFVDLVNGPYVISGSFEVDDRVADVVDLMSIEEMARSIVLDKSARQGRCPKGHVSASPARPQAPERQPESPVDGPQASGGQPPARSSASPPPGRRQHLGTAHLSGSTAAGTVGYTITLAEDWVLDCRDSGVLGGTPLYDCPYPRGAQGLAGPNVGMLWLVVGLARDYPAVDRTLKTDRVAQRRRPERFKSIEFNGWSGDLSISASPRHMAVMGGKPVWAPARTTILLDLVNGPYVIAGSYKADDRVADVIDLRSIESMVRSIVLDTPSSPARGVAPSLSAPSAAQP